MGKSQWGDRLMQWGDRLMLLFFNGKPDRCSSKKITVGNVNNCGKDGNVLPVPSPHPPSNSVNPCIMETRVCSRKNIKLRDEDCWIDHISRLPDELLVSILSCVSLKEAVASSILSRRWRFLWTFISKLDFEGSDFWTSFTSKPDFDIRGFPLRSKGEASIREGWEYVGWVDNVLGLRDKSAAAIEELRISFSLNESHQSYIDRWIRFALAKKVVRLDLNLVRTRSLMNPYTFHESHDSCGFKELRLIRMVSVNLSDGALEIFLRSCPLLEEIFFAKCFELSTVKIVSPFPALKRLTIIFCNQLESVEVCDSNLVYFMYRGTLRPLKYFLLKNVPLLVEMNVGGQVTVKVEEFLTMFSSYLPQLEKLTVEKRWPLSIMEADMIRSSVKMSNVKEFVWKVVGYYSGVMNLEGVAILAGALPLLQRLVVMPYCDVVKGIAGRFFNHTRRYTRTYTYSKLRRYTRTYTYSELKQVEFVGYHGCVEELSFLAYFLENATAPALEEVIIHPPKELCIGVSVWIGEYTKQEIDAFRSLAKSQLTTRMPSTVTLKIL